MIRLRALLQLQGQALLVGAALALVFLALAWKHSAPTDDHMAADGDDMAAVIATCLAVISAGVGLLGAVWGTIALRRRRPLRRLTWSATVGVFQPGLPSPVAARAGPAELQVFLR